MHRRNMGGSRSIVSGSVTIINTPVSVPRYPKAIFEGEIRSPRRIGTVSLAPFDLTIVECVRDGKIDERVGLAFFSALDENVPNARYLETAINEVWPKSHIVGYALHLQGRIRGASNAARFRPTGTKRQELRFIEE